jgi:hypothetical protein
MRPSTIPLCAATSHARCSHCTTPQLPQALEFWHADASGTSVGAETASSATERSTADAARSGLSLCLRAFIATSFLARTVRRCPNRALRRHQSAANERWRKVGEEAAKVALRPGCRESPLRESDQAV